MPTARLLTIWTLEGSNRTEIRGRVSSPTGLSPQFTFTPWWLGKLCPCAVSLSELIRLTGPFSAGPNATYSPESFHCSTEQQVLSVRGIDFHSWCDSATITSLLKKLPVLCHGFQCTVCVHACEHVVNQCVLKCIHSWQQRKRKTEIGSPWIVVISLGAWLHRSERLWYRVWICRDR